MFDWVSLQAFLTHFTALHTARSMRTRRLAQADDDPTIARTARLAQVFQEIFSTVIRAKGKGRSPAFSSSARRPASPNDPWSLPFAQWERTGRASPGGSQLPVSQESSLVLSERGRGRLGGSLDHRKEYHDRALQDSRGVLKSFTNVYTMHLTDEAHARWRPLVIWARYHLEAARSSESPPVCYSAFFTFKQSRRLPPLTSDQKIAGFEQEAEV